MKAEQVNAPQLLVPLPCCGILEGPRAILFLHWVSLCHNAKQGTARITSLHSSTWFHFTRRQHHFLLRFPATERLRRDCSLWRCQCSILSQQTLQSVVVDFFSSFQRKLPQGASKRFIVLILMAHDSSFFLSIWCCISPSVETIAASVANRSSSSLFFCLWLWLYGSKVNILVYFSRSETGLHSGLPI
jgi:hypothetical protein